MDGGGDQHGQGRVPEGVTGPTGPPTAWPDGTPLGGPPAPPVGPPAGGPPVWASPSWGPPPGGRPPLGGPQIPPSAPAPQPRRGRPFLVALGVVLAVVAVAVAVVMADPMGVRSDEDAVGWREDASAEDLGPVEERPADEGPDPTSTTTTQPPTTTTAPPVRLAPLPAPPAVAGFYSFIRREADGDPVAWDPCETIQYVVNSRTAPPGGEEILAEAMAKVSEASGLVFEARGATDEPPAADRSKRDPARYGDGWSPVLVAWTDPDESPDLAGGVGGQATPYSVSTSHGEEENVTGIVNLDGPEITTFLDSGWRTQVLHLVMHELGHLVGLDHVEDIREVMYHNTDGRGEVDAEWNDGDRAGLVAAGSGDCDPDV